MAIKREFWAVLHDGQYHENEIVFEPLTDRVLYGSGETLADIVAKYDNPKATLVRGAFICDAHTIEVLCGTRPAYILWGDPAKAASQNSHRLQSLASGSWDHLGVLPGCVSRHDTGLVLPVRRSGDEFVEKAVDTVAAKVEEFKKQRKLAKSVNETTEEI